MGRGFEGKAGRRRFWALAAAGLVAAMAAARLIDWLLAMAFGW